MKKTEVACALLARDGRGIGNLVPTNAVMEITTHEGVDGIMLGTSQKYTYPPLADTSRAITSKGKNGVVEWKK